VFQFHGGMLTPEDVEHIPHRGRLEALREAYEQGKVRFLGFTGEGRGRRRRSSRSASSTSSSCATTGSTGSPRSTRRTRRGTPGWGSR
jgi:hypothetical protein